jgi:hypothetical protein
VRSWGGGVKKDLQKRKVGRWWQNTQNREEKASVMKEAK